MQNRIVRMMLETLDGPQTVALTQHGQDFYDREMIASQRFEERAFIRAKGVPARSAIIASLRVTMDLDVARLNFAKITALLVVTPVILEFHGVSPPREAKDTPIDLSRLRYPLLDFHG